MKRLVLMAALALFAVVPVAQPASSGGLLKFRNPVKLAQAFDSVLGKDWACSAYTHLTGPANWKNGKEIICFHRARGKDDGSAVIHKFGNHQIHTLIEILGEQPIHRFDTVKPGGKFYPYV